MAQRVIIPRMGQTMTEGIIAKWYKNDGAAVRAGDDIYELEYDKATSTVQAKKEGIIKLLFEEGAAVPLGEAVAVILEEGETFDASLAKSAHSVANAAMGGADEAKAMVEAPREKQFVSGGGPQGSVLATPFVRALARKMGIDIQMIAKPGDRVTKEDLEAFGGQKKTMQHNCEECSKCEPVRISPLARKMAKEHNIDISNVTPKDGVRITKDDITAYLQSPAKQTASLKGRREPVRGMRKVIAERMAQSYFTYPTVTLTTDANMAELLKLREQFNEEYAERGIKLTVTDLLIKAVAKALLENEIVNTSLADDEIIYHEEVNIGVAVALQNGLVVPVVRNADRLRPDEISQETKRLTDLAKNGQIGGDDMEGGTFTITNLGPMGIDAFNPIINYPQSAILGVGRTVKKPVVADDEIVIQPRAVLSLTHDHRVIDGAPAAYFLQTLVRYIEKPFLLFID